MASAIYVYENAKEFENYYKGYTEDSFKTLKIIDMYIHDEDRLWVVTNTNDEKERPMLQKSLCHFRNGSVDEYKTDKTVLVVFEKIKFDFKKSKLKFFPKFLDFLGRKPKLTWKVDRYFGDGKPKCNTIDYNHRYYDFETDRINLILKS